MRDSTALTPGLWSKWWRLGRDERRALRHALLLVPAMHVAVRVVGFNRLQRWVATTPATGRPLSTTDALRVSVLGINRVKRFSLLTGNCLSQSLALERMLRRRGVGPALQLGVRLTGPKFEAHAWVEYDGRVLNGTQDVHTRFTPLAPTTSGKVEPTGLR